ncbi:MAG: RNase adapter RapZ, partial [Candidatus Saccharicenans sp.]|nr:RNase adapter RapZ [Candidatus Saccharicenans sp.]
MGKDRGNGDFIIITGLSGSGKTVVSRFLEDLGYYCVDNLPAKLIPGLVDLWQKGKVEIDRMALVIDIREPNFLNDFPQILKQLRAKPRLIFLEAADEALV